ncbi:MAG TPA: outer membrane lipoprotein carrier protein LolA [Bacteroidales bacterium]|nr:outer membrane lipoprotein carrier protein LolA [Bacteroidales bacterium]
MKKYFYLSLIFLLLFNTSYGQNDSKAVEILDKVSAHMKTFNAIYAEFLFILENNQENITDKRLGKIWIKADKYKIDMMGTKTFFDGKTQWTYLKESNEVNITRPEDDDDESINPAKIFDIYREGFKLRYVAQKFEDTRALYIIDLYPTDKSKPFSRITLKIDKDKNELYMFKRFDKDGNYYTIKIGKLSEGKNITDAMFVFNKAKYPGVEVIDLRD